jgi:YidC/Oxa1 family membrane protein insertase
VEKRLPLAILLSLVVLIVWQLTNPPPPPRPNAPGSAPAAAGGSSGELGSPGGTVVVNQDGAQVTVPTGDGPAAAPAQVAAQIEETLVVEFGQPGAVGHFRAEFTNRGAELVDLRTGTYFNRVGLSEEERRDPRHWLRLIDPVRLPEGRPASGAFALEPVASGRDLTDRPLGEVLWEMTPLPGADGRPAGVEFRYAGANGVLFRKRVTAVPDRWELQLELTLESPAELPAGLLPGPRGAAMVAAGAIGVEVEDSFYRQPKAVAVGPRSSRSPDLESEVAELGARRRHGVLDVPGPLAVVGVHNKYFAVLLRAAEPDAAAAIGSATWRRFDGYGPLRQDSTPALGAPPPVAALAPYIVADAQLELFLPRAGEQRHWTFQLYAGPKDHRHFLELEAAHAEVLDSELSWFSGIGNFLIEVLSFLHGALGNWGVAIIALTFVIRILLFPLNRRSQTAMGRYQKKMKRLQPKLEEIKQKYAEDPQKLREAQARIMQEEGAFPPLGGCLPIFLQMPVFFGLFAALRTSFDLRHAGFVGYIQDLSRPDELLYLGWNIPFLGLEYLNLLPILMVVMWIWQQKSMPQPTDEQARRVQRIMLFMPVVMGVFLYNYAAGLSLYMVTQSTLGIFEQKVIKRFWPIDDTEVETKKPGGCAPFAEAMRKAAEQQQQRQRQLRGESGGAKSRKERR